MSRSKLKCFECSAVMGDGPVCPQCGWTYAPESAPQDSDDAIDVVSAEMPDSTPLNDIGVKPLATTTKVALPPVGTDAGLWLEVIAVLAVGVIPYFAYAIWTYAIGSYDRSAVPEVSAFVTRSIHNGCVGYVTMYLIYRSGEPWKRFGISRLCMNDIILSVVLLMVARIVGAFCFLVTPGTTSNVDLQPSAHTPLEFFVVVVSNFIGGFSEEIVTRAYLITRFEQLLKSQLQAVLLASSLFASYHIYQGLGGAFNALLFGLAYSGAFPLFRSLWPLGLGHSWSNIFTELQLYGH